MCGEKKYGEGPKKENLGISNVCLKNYGQSMK